MIPFTPRHCTIHVALPGWCHVASSGGATWHFLIGPRGPLKIPMVGDTWQPVVLPCGMMTSTSIWWHHPAMSFVDVSSTDNKVSHVYWSWLTASLTMNIFQIITLFDDSFALLEILRCAIRDRAIFIEF
jgi:hypothetical protein